MPRSPLQKQSLDHKGSRLFESSKLKLHAKRESGISEGEAAKLSNKMVTTDESNNGYDSKLHESIFMAGPAPPNDEYFNQPLAFRAKKRKAAGGNRLMKQSRLQNISQKL